jgi:hypothetical protein
VICSNKKDSRSAETVDDKSDQKIVQQKPTKWEQINGTVNNKNRSIVKQVSRDIESGKKKYCRKKKPHGANDV